MEEHVITYRIPAYTDLTALASLTGPVLTLTMNTHVHGRASAQDGVRFGHLLDDVDTTLTAEGHERKWTKQFLAPLRDLAENADFWQHQRSSFAVFKNLNELHYFQLDTSINEVLAISDVPVVSTILPHLEDVSPFLLLAISKNDVRLYECDQSSAQRVVDERLPDSFDEALQFEDPEAQLQFHTSGGSTITHGHGKGDEVAKERLDRFLTAVDRAVTARESTAPRPLVLAAVDHNTTRFRQLSAYPTLFPESLSGNPDRTSLADLHRDAKALLVAQAKATRGNQAESQRVLAGTGRLELEPQAIGEAAASGRIETLWIHHPLVDDQPTNELIVSTLRAGGNVAYTATPIVDGANLTAVTRW